MKYIGTLLILFLSILCKGQSASSSHMSSVTGSIYIPPLQSMSIDLLRNEAIHFSKAEEFDHGKLLQNFIRATVTSNIPYFINVSASGDSFISEDNNGERIPVSIVSLRHGSNPLINLSVAPKPLLVSTTNNIKMVYNFDAYFNPGWKVSGGQYSTIVTFTLTPQ